MATQGQSGVTNLGGLNLSEIYSATVAASGGAESFAHGLSVTPTVVIVQPLAAINQAAAPSADATNVTINMSGAGNVLITAY